jgi:hypothetical protein
MAGKPKKVSLSALLHPDKALTSELEQAGEEPLVFAAFSGAQAASKGTIECRT